MGLVSFFDQVNSYLTSQSIDSKPSLQKAIKHAHQIISQTNVEALSPKQSLLCMRKVCSCFKACPEVRKGIQEIMHTEIEKMRQLSEKVLPQKRPVVAIQEPSEKRRRHEEAAASTQEPMQVEESKPEKISKKRVRKGGGEELEPPKARLKKIKLGVTRATQTSEPSSSEELKTKEERAATYIQKCFRGYLARKAFLSRTLFPRYREQVEKGMKERFEMPLAQGGGTPVYLPEKVPEVVLKNSGRRSAVSRFHQMQSCREILQKQNCSHLTIPKAALYRGFIVEQRLPINVNHFYNIRLYVTHTHLFDEAVREITRMFSRASLRDLIAYDDNPFRHIAGVGYHIRYDNLPLYLEKKNGKEEGNICLIDLETLRIKRSQYFTDNDLETLALIFPYHVDIIKDEVKKLDVPTRRTQLCLFEENVIKDEVEKFNNKILEEAATRGKNFFRPAFTAHCDWLKQKGISLNAAPPPLEISPQRIEGLTLVLEKELLKINNGENDLYVRKNVWRNPNRDLFIGNPAAVAKKLATAICPLIISNLKKELEKYQKSKEYSKNQLSESEVVDIRSPVLTYEELSAEVSKLLWNEQNIDVPKMQEEQTFIRQQLTYIIMQELVKTGELFYFEEDYGGGFDSCWIGY